MQVYGLEHYYCVNGVEWCWPRGISHSKHVLLFAGQYASAGADEQDPVRLAPLMSISPLNYSMTSKSTEVVTLEFESHGRENWHSPRSYDVQGSHGLMLPFLKVPVTPCIYDMSTALNGVPKHSRRHDDVDFFGSRIKASQTYMKHVCGTTGSRLKLHMYKSAVDIC